MGSLSLYSCTPARILGACEAHPLLTEKDVASLTAEGVSPSAINIPDPLRVGYVSFSGPDRFMMERWTPPGTETTRAFLVLVRDVIGDPLDVVAWDRTTGRLASWLGMAWGLGQDTAFAPRLSGGLAVYQTPIEWLKASRNGVCIFDPPAAVRDLDGAHPLIARDARHGRELRDRMTIRPRILISKARRAA